MKLIDTAFVRCEHIYLYQDDEGYYSLQGDAIAVHERDGTFFWELVRDFFPVQAKTLEPVATFVRQNAFIQEQFQLLTA